MVPSLSSLEARPPSPPTKRGVDFLQKGRMEGEGVDVEGQIQDTFVTD